MMRAISYKHSIHASGMRPRSLEMYLIVKSIQVTAYEAKSVGLDTICCVPFKALGFVSTRTLDEISAIN